MSATATVPPALRDVQASYRLVYLVLVNSREDALSAEEIVDRTSACRPTVDQALVTLRRHGLVESREHPDDGRRHLHAATEVGQ